MFHLALYEPEIPPNTGNIIRLCGNTGCHLHLIQPLGFNLSDKQLKRAGLDYHDLSTTTEHANYAKFLDCMGSHRIFAFSTHGQKCYSEVSYRQGDVLLFGPETRGLPVDIRESFDSEHLLTLPMRPNSRSLNLSKSVAIAAYEAWRQLGFIGASKAR